MQAVTVNYLAILLCGVVSMVLGSLWYGPLFGKMWMSLSGVSMGGEKKSMTKSYLIAFVGALIMAFVLAHALVFAAAYLKASGVSGGLMAGFWNWLGFVAPVTLGMVLWEGKSWKLWTLVNGYHLVQLLIFGVILSLWK